MSIPPPDQPVPETPGMEALFRALTAEGDATELVRRQAALTMFRQARDQAAVTPPPRVQAGHDVPGARDVPTRRPPHRRPPPRRPRASRRAGVAAALIVACAGLAAAAYAQVLPDPVQDIAHTVLAPLGVPSASHGPGGASGGPGASATPTGSGPRGSSASPSGTTPCPCPTAGAGGTEVLRLSVARPRVPAGAADTFTGYAVRDGHPARHVRVRLLAQGPASPGTWRVIGTGLSDVNGAVTFTVPRVPATETFRLAGTGRLASLSSPEVTVRVSPLVVVRHPAAGLLTVAVYPSRAGDPVTLEQLQAGTWVPVATGRLDALHKAAFPVTAGRVYRFLVPVTAEHAAAASTRFKVPVTAALATTTPMVTATPSVRRSRL